MNEKLGELRQVAQAHPCRCRQQA